MSTVISRRNLLKWGVTGTGAVLVSGLGGGCAGTRRSARPLLADFASDSFQPDMEEILYWASLAPSSHNAQPWSVQVIDQTHLNLAIAPNRCLPVVDPKAREMAISMGAFIENLDRAAGETGWKIMVQNVVNSAHSTPLCTVSLLPQARKNGNLDSLRQRRTIRHHLLGGDTVVRLCTRWAQAKSDLVFIPMESDLGGKIGRLATDSFARQTGDDAAQAELANWIRLKNRDARSQRDGLSTEAMEMTGVGGWFVRTFMNRDSVMGNSFREKGIADTRQMVEQGAGWFVLTSRSDDVPDCIEVGRSFEDLALSCVPQQVALHPMSQALEYSDSRHALKELLGLQEQPQLLLRAGRVRTWLEPVSLRRSPSEFINEKQ